MFHRTCAFVPLFLLCCTQALCAQTSLADTVWKKHMGGRAPLSVSTPATGLWADEHPFDPKTFGTIRGFSPATGAKNAIVMVYVRSLNENTLNLLQAIDAVISTQEDLKWSYVQIFDEKGAQVGGYTADEILARIAGLKQIADDQKIKSLSLGLAANGLPKSAEQVGLNNDNDIVVAFLRKPPKPKSAPVVAWFRAFLSTQLTPANIAEFSKALEETIAHP
jgi:hypothetical protein